MYHKTVAHDPEYLDVKAAARYCGVSISTIRRHSAPGYSGPYPLHPAPWARRLGRVMFTRAELDRWRALDRKPGRRWPKDRS